ERNRLAGFHDLELLLQGGNRHDAMVGVLKMHPRLFRAYCPGFYEEDACDDLQTVCETVLYLLQQQFLLPQELIQLVLLRAPLGNVFEGQKNRGVRTLLVEYLSGTKKHRASADTGKVLLDFVIFHYGVLRRNVLQQKP